MPKPWKPSKPQTPPPSLSDIFQRVCPYCNHRLTYQTLIQPAIGKQGPKVLLFGVPTEKLEEDWYPWEVVSIPPYRDWHDEEPDKPWW